MAELPLATPLIAKHLDFSCVSCGEQVGVLSSLPCIHSVSVCEKKECRLNLLDRKTSCSHCKETFSFPAEGFPCYTLSEREAIAKRCEEEVTFCRGQHKSPKLAVVFCSDCPGTFCEECNNVHGMVPFWKHHKIKSLKKIPREGTSSRFVSEKREEAEKILSQVDYLGADPETSTMEGLTIANSTVECRPWNVPLIFEVVTSDHSGRQCAFGGENVISVLTPTTARIAVLGKVEDNGDGTYQVIFVSVPSKECKLSVTVHGVHVKGSPVNLKMCYPNTIKQEIRDQHKERWFRALVCTKQGTLLATDLLNEEVCTFTKHGEILKSFKVQDPGETLDGIASLSNGNVAVSLGSGRCIAVHRPNGELVQKFGFDRLNGPHGLAVNSKGQLFVAEWSSHRVSVYSENGEFQYSFGSRGSQPGEFDRPVQICIDQDGLVYVSDRDNNRVQIFQQDGRFVRQFGSDVLSGPAGLALTKDGHIVVASYRFSHKICIFSQSGECVQEVKDVGLGDPYGLAITDDGFIVVADVGSSRMVMF